MRVTMVVALGALLLAGCAAATRGTSENVKFESEPSGALMTSAWVDLCEENGSCPDQLEARLSGEEIPEFAGPSCVTPCALDIPRNRELIATFTKAGYRPSSVRLQRAKVAEATSPLLSITGAAIDHGTGAAMDHVPNPMRVQLEPLASLPKRRR